MLVGARHASPSCDKLMSIEELQSRFAIPNALHFELDEHGMERAVVQTPQAEAIIYLQGAHITHYQPSGHKPVLFLSSKSNFAPEKAIRGGIPIIFPWFGAKKDDPAAPMHGFARTSRWTLVNVYQDEADDPGVLELAFLLDLSKIEVSFNARFGRTLEMELSVANKSASSFEFEEALHTYLAVSDVRQIEIHGLASRKFIDKTDQMRQKQSPPDPLRIIGETDRIYLDSGSQCTVVDPTERRRITIFKSNSHNTVVWNPWIEKNLKMADLGNDEWRSMLCVETANVGDAAIRLNPGETHTMSASILVEPA